MKLSKLVLNDGSLFAGYSPQWQEGVFYGEVVFTTGMTGYFESLTDPSYSGHILTFTYPLIGNYGIPDASHWESQKIHVAAVVVSEACEQWSHYLGTQSFLDWLKKESVPLITGLDTRALTKRLRHHGVMSGAIADLDQDHFSFPNYEKEHLVSKVSVREVQTYGEGEKIVIVVDCGMKENILRMLKSFPIRIKRVPHDYDYSEESFDAVLLSNGPGNPQMCQKTVEVLKKAMRKEKPIFGICLGLQLLALAAGATTYKLPYGHRGHNQPCIDLSNDACYVTSQNHGYAVHAESLPKEWCVRFKNLNDGTVEGIAHRSLPFFAVQFHPEAAPGPTDTENLFQEFIHAMDCNDAVV